MATSTTGAPRSRRGQRGGKIRCLDEALENPAKIFKASVNLTGEELVAGHELAKQAGVSFNVLVGELIQERTRQVTASPPPVRQVRAAANAVITDMLPDFDSLQAPTETAA